MSREMINDFVVETKGRCFLCLHRIPSKLTTTDDLDGTPLGKLPPAQQHHSLQCLSQHLKMDMKKVFLENGPIPGDLLAQVQQSRLKVELCEECISINDKFTGLYRQVEKLEMEMASVISLVHYKLEQAKCLQTLADTNEEALTIKLQVAEALRKDASENCLRKLKIGCPRVHIQNLAIEQVKKVKSKIKSYLEIPKAQSSSRQDSSIKEEYCYNDDDDNDDGASVFGSSCEPDFENEEETHTNDMKVEVGNSKSNPRDINVDGLDCELESRSKTKEADSLTAIPTPITVIDNEGKVGGCSLNPNTGKYKCSRCPKEYTQKTNFGKHYKKVHLEGKFKCVSCEKEFPYKQAYEKHYLNVHMGVRYKCNQCDTTFTQKHTLQRHRKSAHLGQRYSCQFCSKVFRRPSYRNDHMRRNCIRKNLSISSASKSDL